MNTPVVDRCGVEPFRVLTVCVGNVCRSPLAQVLLGCRLREAVLAGKLEVSSAGIRGLVGRTMESNAADELRRLGGDPIGFQARLISPDMIAEADLILAMTKDVRSSVLEMHPRSLRRTFTLLEFAALCRRAIDRNAAVFGPEDLVEFAGRERSHVASLQQDITDPIGRSADVHRNVADQIGESVLVLSALLAPLLRD